MGKEIKEKIKEIAIIIFGAGIIAVAIWLGIIRADWIWVALATMFGGVIILSGSVNLTRLIKKGQGKVDDQKII